jgi:flagellar assembly factor FliW
VSRVCDCKTSSTTHKWLQSLDEPAVAFVIIDPDLLLADYHIDVSGDALAEVRGSEADEFSACHPLFLATASGSTQCLVQAPAIAR